MLREADIVAMKLALEALENLKTIFVQVQILGLSNGASGKDMRVDEELIHDRAIVLLRERIAVHNEVRVRKDEDITMWADAPVHKLDLSTLRTGDRVKVTYDGAVIDKAATLLCTPRRRQPWLTLTFIDEGWHEFFHSRRRDVRVEEIDGCLYACGGWRGEIVE